MLIAHPVIPTTPPASHSREPRSAPSVLIGMTKDDRGRGNGAGVLDQVARVEGDRPDEREREADEQVAHERVGGVVRATMPM